MPTGLLIQPLLSHRAYLKAVDCAVNSRQWTKAVHILESMNNTKEVHVFYRKIAVHYASVGEHHTAEDFYVRAGALREAIDMYNQAGLWEDAQRLASGAIDRGELSEMYLGKAAELEASGKFKVRKFASFKEVHCACNFSHHCRKQNACTSPSKKSTKPSPCLNATGCTRT